MDISGRFFEKKYKVCENAPKEVEWGKYYSEIMEEYKKLLENYSDSEKVFQEFFEKNPSFVPGALGMGGGLSGHYPHMDTLISQPEIGIAVKRKPDFLWLAQDSVDFTPVFIEIERPNKSMFTKEKIPNKDFNQALNQLDEWRGILNGGVNIQAFYQNFSIPLSMQQKNFKPKFVLIYGRRNEYENDEYLQKIRSSKQREDVWIMSFDRLLAIFEYKQFTSCRMSQGKYEILHIPPTFRYRADRVSELVKYEGFEGAIDHMEMTSAERKKFLHDRFPYWKNRAEIICKGMIVSQEGE